MITKTYRLVIAVVLFPFAWIAFWLGYCSQIIYMAFGSGMIVADEDAKHRFAAESIRKDVT